MRDRSPGQLKGGLASIAMERRPAQRQTRAERSRSSSVTRLPIQRSASVISQSLRMPTGPSAASVFGTVKMPARRRQTSAEPKHRARIRDAALRPCPGAVGSEDLTGPYEVVKGWPKDISTLPGNEKWTYGAGQGVFAESPNRVFMLFRGELPKMAAPKAALLPQLGPSISFPVAGLWRDATTASLPGVGGTDQDTRNG